MRLEQVDEPRRDVVGMNDERFPLVEDHVEGDAEVCQCRTGPEKPAIGNADLAVVGGLRQRDWVVADQRERVGEVLGILELHR
jgi:hypothetical protein